LPPKAIIGTLPTYGYRRVLALLVREVREQGHAPPNHKRVYRVMKAHCLLLQRRAGGAEGRRHDGRIAVERSNLRWCSDGFEIGCDNGEKVRVAFALDCCDREVLGHVATLEGIKDEDVQDLMITAVEYRLGPVNRLPETIEWLSDNGSGYIARGPEASRGKWVWSRARRRCRARRATAWRKLSCARSSGIMCG
jgi:putative transposase